MDSTQRIAWEHGVGKERGGTAELYLGDKARVVVGYIEMANGGGASR